MVVSQMNAFKLYAILCGAISDALDCLPLLSENVRARQILEQAAAQTEELYIQESEDHAD